MKKSVTKQFVVAFFIGVILCSTDIMFLIQSIDRQLTTDAIIRANPNFSNTHFPDSRSNNWFIETIGAEDYNRSKPSIALDSRSLPHISFFSFKVINSEYGIYENCLQYCYYDGLQWHIETVESQQEGTVGRFNSIALDGNDTPYISYYDELNEDLKYAYRTDGQWYSEIVDSEGKVGRFPSIALNANDRPHISYYDESNGDLKYAFYNNNQWHIEIVDSLGDVGRWSSIALGRNGTPHISYTCYGEGGYDLKHAYYDGDLSWHIEIVDYFGDVGKGASIAIDSNDRPHISYRATEDFDGYLKYAYYNGSKWNDEIVDLVDHYDSYTSLDLDGNDKPHITYCDYDNGLQILQKYVYYDGNEWYIDILKVPGEVLSTSSISVDSNNTPHMSFSQHFENGEHEYDLIYAIMDNTPPNLDSDFSPISGTTGDNFIFNVSTSDEHGIDAVYVNWSHDGLQSNESLTSVNGYWTANITTSHCIEDLIYTIYVVDSANNIFVTPSQEVPITDNDIPTFIEDNTYQIARTGERLIISARINDNIGVDSTYVTYSFISSIRMNCSMTPVENDVWNHTVSIPINATILNYSFHIEDQAGNSFTTEDFSNQIMDNQIPVAKAGEDVTADQHEKVSFNAGESSDNIGITSYNWSFVYDDIDHMFFGKVVNFTFDKIGVYIITVNVSDAEGNWATDTLNVTVLDTTSPTANAGENLTIYTSDIVFLNGSRSSDDVEIVNYTWTFEYDLTEYELYGINHSFTFSIPGTYNVTLIVSDFAGNTDTDNLTLTVLDRDSDSDGYNDTYENEAESDPHDPNSTPLDWDGDGWNNTIETQIGTDPWDNHSIPSDMDGDHIPDSIDLDIDGDGIPNEKDLNPYDPDIIRDEDTKGDESHISWLVICLILIVAAIVISSLIVGKRRRNNGRTGGINADGTNREELGRQERPEE